MPRRKKFNRKDRLRRSVSRLDDITLDRAWESALRGDMEATDAILKKVGVQDLADDSISWKDSSYFLFGRKPFKRD